MNKLMILTLTGMALTMNAHAASGAKKLATCTAKENDLTVQVFQKPDGQAVAKLSVQSIGDSWPTYTFKVSDGKSSEEQSEKTKVFSNDEFKLVINTDTKNGSLQVDNELQLRRTGLECKL